MSAISQKSISGITSITTPAGVDNVFTVHTNDTTERFRVDSTGSLNIAGISTFSEGIFIPDDKKLSIGNASGNNGDLQLFHTTSHSIIRDYGTGSLLIQGSGVFIQNSNGGTNIASFLENTGVSIPLDLDVDGHTNLDNVSIAGVTTFNDNAHFKLNDKLYFGNNNELEIYQQGNNSFIYNNDDNFVIGQVGQGAAHPMKIYGGTEFELKHYHTNGGQLSVFKSIRGGAFTLYHAGSNNPSADQIRLETTSTGLNFPRDIDVDGHTELDNVNISGVVTATTFIGDGSNLTGVSGFATALSNDQSSSLNVFFKTPKQVNVSTGESIVVQSDATSGNIAFCRESIIHVSTGATMRVATGTQLRMNVLDLF